MLTAMVHLQRPDETPIGDIAVPIDESWIVLPPHLAKECIKLEGGDWSAADIASGELVVLIRVIGGNAEFFIGTKEDAEAKMREPRPGSFGGKASVQFDSYVLKPDGTIVH